MAVSTHNNLTKKDFLKLSESKQPRQIRSIKSSKTILIYKEAKEKLLSIWYLNPPVKQIVKYLKAMEKTLCDEWGFLCKREIIHKIFIDTIEIGFSKSQIKQLLLYEEN